MINARRDIAARCRAMLRDICPQVRAGRGGGPGSFNFAERATPRPDDSCSALGSIV
jgi:hypothetical protein